MNIVHNLTIDKDSLTVIREDVTNSWRAICNAKDEKTNIVYYLIWVDIPFVSKNFKFGKLIEFLKYTEPDAVGTIE